MREIQQQITDMQVGDQLQYPVAKVNLVRKAASDVGLINIRKYSTKADRDSGMVTVTRLT